VRITVFVVILSLIFVAGAGADQICAPAAPQDTQAIDTGEAASPERILENTRAAAAASSRARAAQAAASRASAQAQAADRRARIAQAVARAAASRNEEQADHGHANRDYATTMWRQLWGDSGTPPEIRQAIRENDGFFGWVSNHETRLDSHAIALLVIALVALIALALALLAIFRPRGGNGEQTTAPPNGGSPPDEPPDQAREATAISERDLNEDGAEESNNGNDPDASGSTEETEVDMASLVGAKS